MSPEHELSLEWLTVWPICVSTCRNAIGEIASHWHH